MTKQTTNSASRLITVASGKGGVGKTWLSVTLAHALARLGRKVLLFDGDFGLANVDIQLGIVPDSDLGSILAGDATLAQSVTKFSDPVGVKFDVIAGKSGSGALGSLATETLTALRDDLVTYSEEYDHVLLDLAAGIDPSVSILSHHDGDILVVMSGDPTSLTDAYAFIKLTVARNPDAKISIVVNNVATKKDGEKVYEAIKRAAEGFLKISPPLAGIIKSDSKVVDAIRAQMPLLARHPQSIAAADVMSLAGRLTG